MNLDGAKTYIVAAATIMYALGGMILGNLDYNVGVPMILAALGVSAARDTAAKAQAELKRIREVMNSVRINTTDKNRP